MKYEISKWFSNLSVHQLDPTEWSQWFTERQTVNNVQVMKPTPQHQILAEQQLELFRWMPAAPTSKSECVGASTCPSNEHINGNNLDTYMDAALLWIIAHSQEPSCKF